MSAESGVVEKADFNLKTPVEVAMFLKGSGIGGDVCDTFEGKLCNFALCYNVCFYTTYCVVLLPSFLQRTKLTVKLF